MNMTFRDWINNPMGRKNAVMSNREMYRDMYRNKLDKILVREVGKVKYDLYHTKEKFYIHMYIPSETVPEFYYDTVIEFYTDNPAISVGRDLKKYYVNFYSNDPSFVYTFAHAFLENKMFIKDLVPRMSKEAVKKVATEKNPKNEVGYVKSIYFAYLLIEKYKLFDKNQFDIYGKKYTKKAILSKVTHATKKVEDRKEAGEKLRVKKKKKKDKDRRESKRKADAAIRNERIRAGSASVAKKTGTARKAPTAKRAKKI